MSSEPSDFPVVQQEDAVDVRRMALTAVVALLVGGAAVLSAAGILASQTRRLRPSAAGPAGMLPAPRAIDNIEQTPIELSRTGLDLREEQRRELARWGWVDRDAGIATIPIERAIDLVVARSRP